MSSAGEVVAVGSPRFTLHTLGWRAFQDLCAAVLREVWGQSVQAFADSNDGGRDGAFYGTWQPPNELGDTQDIPPGPFVVQCKHTKKADATLAPSELEDEFAKASALVKRGVCGTYVLLTNARVTGTSEEEIRRRLRAAGVAHPLVLDGQWLSDMIAAHRGLRMFVPRVYGLGDLSQILDERAYAQASVLMASAPEQVATFVVTGVYRKAARALRDHGFVLLLGDPAVGKSVIALMLAISAADNWGCAAIKARTSEELVQRWNPHEKDQFFWLDDAFGAVRHEEHLTHAWARDLPHVMSAVKNGARVVLTSRSYIYNEARPLLKSYAYPRLHEQHVTVDVADLTRQERQQILYNHLAAGDQPQDVRAQMKPHLEAAADATPFRPEAARRLGLQAFTSKSPLTRQGITTFMAQSQQLLSDVYNQLDTHAHAALALTYATARDKALPGLPNPVVFDAGDRDIVERAGSTRAGVSKALAALTGSFLRLSTSSDGQEYWTFHHPTLREGFAAWLTTQPHLLPMVLMGMSDQALLSRTDCLAPGSEQRQGTLLRIPPSLYLDVARRVAVLRQQPHGRLESWQQSHDRQQAVQAYLAHSSCDSFLRAYVETDPQVYEELVQFRPLASYDVRTTVLARLYQAGLLPEETRRRAVEHMKELAVSSLDPSWIDGKAWRVLLTKEDREVLFAYVRQELVPQLDDMLSDWLSDADGGDDDPVDNALFQYSWAFGQRGDDDAAAEFDHARDFYNDERRSRPPSNDSWEPAAANDHSGQRGGHQPPGPHRSLFDDIDQ
ncbi:restriction endonuclease [Streptomyces sp. MUM 203J]|uniref:nSTAND3 domain-containing NTPase n=1 Tax=Streptomyces sp. MUM 203J TaxID=2791990 RepID=UPI001F04DC4F|nr:restriction endonuclease [Streptomyces sp. MUM 203J]MCH0543147.1 restriction endonuclease [Streptomyces sp. MUM 203J]